MTITQIEQTIAATLTKELGVTVDVTSNRPSEWTISGNDKEARTAAEWLVSQSIMKFEDAPLYDEELDTTFCYMLDFVK